MDQQQIEAEMSRLRAEQASLNAKMFKEKFLPSVKKMLGKTYVYRRNCYSCPSKETDYWDVFRKVLAVHCEEADQGATVVCEVIQIDSHGSASITTQRNFFNLDMTVFIGCVPCPTSEYKKERARVLREIACPQLILQA